MPRPQDSHGRARPLAAGLLGALTASAACVPAGEAPLDTTGYATLITGDLVSGEFVPRVIDLREEHGPLVFTAARDAVVPLGLWRTTREELRLPAEVVAAPVGSCAAQRLPLEEAHEVVCLSPGDFGPCPTPLDPRAAVLTLPWPEPDPCTPWSFDADFTRVDFDVQTTTSTTAGNDMVASGAAYVLVPLSPGRVLIGQLSGGVLRPDQKNTELAVMSPADLDAIDQVPRARFRTAFTAGARRSDDEAWLGTSDGALMAFDVRTGTPAAIVAGDRAVGAISDLATHPSDPERVYAVTQTCGLYVREPGAQTWTPIQPSLQDLRVVGGLLPDECGARITVLAPGEALVGGLPAEFNGRPSVVNFTGNRDLVLRVRGSTATPESPWPEDTTEARRFLQIHAVAHYVDADGQLTEVALGGRYTVTPTPHVAPFSFGEGRNVVFTRPHAPGARWTMRYTFPETQADGTPIAPVIFSDAHGVSGADTRSHFRGFFAGATLTLFAAEELRLRRGSDTGLAELTTGWSTAGMIPLVSRVRPDGDGGWVIATGKSDDARSDFSFRLHWWRPR